MEDTLFALPHARKPDEAIYPLEVDDFPPDGEYYGGRAFGDDWEDAIPAASDRDLTPEELALLAGVELPF